MTLGLTKTYTPAAGQVGNASSYNTDIAALFNAFSGLEAQSATLGGLTITPTANSTTTFNVTNAAGTSIFSVDTTNSLVKYKTLSMVFNNIVQTTLSDDFSISSGTYAERTGATASITTQKATGKVLIIVSSCWSFDAAGGRIAMRINRDTATEYVDLGYSTIGDTTGLAGGAYRLAGGIRLFTGLSAAAHTFTIEVAGNGTNDADNLCSSGTPYQYFELLAMEI